MRCKAREKNGSRRRKSRIDSFFVISLLLSFVFFSHNLFSKRCIYSSPTRLLTNSIAQYSISNESDFTQNNTESQLILLGPSLTLDFPAQNVFTGHSSMWLVYGLPNYRVM